MVYLNSSLRRHIPLLVEWCLWKVQISVSCALNNGLCFGGSFFWNFRNKSSVVASPSPAESAWKATKFRISVKSSIWPFSPFSLSARLSGRKSSVSRPDPVPLALPRTTAQLVRRFIRWRSSDAEIGAALPVLGFFPILPNRGRPEADLATDPFAPVLKKS